MSTQPPDPETVRRFQDNDDESVKHEDERAAPGSPEQDPRRKKVQGERDASDPISVATSPHDEDGDEQQSGERVRDPERRSSQQPGQA